MTDHEHSTNEPNSSGTNGNSSNGASKLRIPTEAPCGTLARGALRADFPEEATVENEVAPEVTPTTEVEVEVATYPNSTEEFVATFGTIYETQSNPYIDEPLPATANDDEFEQWNDSSPDTLEEERLFDTTPDIATHPEWGRDEADNLEDSRLAVATSGDGSDGGDPPSGNFDDQVPSPYDENAASRDREMDLIEHLTELRTRLMWSVSTVAVLMVVTWNYGKLIQNFLGRPINKALLDSKVTGTQQIILPTDGFMIYFQISLVSALILAMPMIIFQAWRFIEPALTKNERRYTSILIPFSIVLFVMGAVLGYFVSPLFFNFFLQFIPEGVEANLSFSDSIILLAKMLLVFGVCFQIPVVTIFLIKAGVVTRNVLIDYWRHVIVAIFTVVAVITPTWDPLTLLVCAVPSCVLYLLSIWLVKWL
jgi:sec-independent protein translocase protein TatC